MRPDNILERRQMEETSKLSMGRKHSRKMLAQNMLVFFTSRSVRIIHVLNSTRLTIASADKDARAARALLPEQRALLALEENTESNNEEEDQEEIREVKKSEYELSREKNIESNNALLNQLGLSGGMQTLIGNKKESKKTTSKDKAKKSATKPESVRRSTRQQWVFSRTKIFLCPAQCSFIHQNGRFH